MRYYLVTLNFQIAYALCDPTLGKTPPGTPGKIAAADSRMSLRLMGEDLDDDTTRTYHCEVICEAETDDGLVEAVITDFNHLAAFRVIDSAVDEVKYPPAESESEGTIPVGAATEEFVVVCHFRSTEAFFRLSHAFDRQISEGVLFPAPKKPGQGQYVAYVVMHTPSSDGLEKTVEDLLRTTFDAHSSETADHFTEVTINLL